MSESKRKTAKNEEAKEGTFSHSFSDFPSGIMDVLNQQRLNCDKLCDIRVVTKDDVIFYAHTSILSASSSYLKSKVEEIKPTSVLSLEVHSEPFKIILEIIYTSKMTVASESISKVICAADLLKLNQVSDVCRRFLETKKNTMDKYDVVNNKGLLYNKNLHQDNANLDIRKSRVFEAEDLSTMPLYSIYNISSPLLCICPFCGALFQNSWAWEIHNQMCQNSYRHIDHAKLPNIVLHGAKSTPSCLQKLLDQTPSTPSILLNNKYSPEQENMSELTNTTNENADEEVDPKMQNEKDENHNNITDNIDKRVKEITSNDRKCYNCTECNSTFPSKAGLSVHLRSHTGERPYCCNVCGKTFTQLGHVQRHQKVHTGEKPFQCTLCSARVRDKASMHYHILAHNGIKPFRCDQCEAKFTKRSSLVKHKNVHTGKFLYQCSKCQASFREKASLSRHKKCQHNL